MSRTYNEPGKARKLCVCGVYVHARSLECPACKHIFGVSKIEKLRTGEGGTIVHRDPIEKKEPTIYTEPGRGRKLCSSCNIYVAARLRECPKCSQTIEKVAKAVDSVKRKLEKQEEEVVDEKAKYVGRLVFAPRGAPPIKPDDDIEHWCTQVFEDGLKDNITYSNEALWLWYQQYNNDPSCRQRISDWSKREGFDKMQGYSPNAVLSSDDAEAETDTLQLLD